MPKAFRLTGLPEIVVDADKGEVLFQLAISEQRPLAFVARYGVAAQVISGIGRALTELKTVLLERKGFEPVAPLQILGSHIQKDRWSDTLILELMTPGDIPYVFALPCQIAAHIADQLKTESAKPTEMGSA